MSHVNISITHFFHGALAVGHSALVVKVEKTKYKEIIALLFELFLSPWRNIKVNESIVSINHLYWKNDILRGCSCENIKEISYEIK